MANESLYASFADSRVQDLMRGTYIEMLAAKDALPQHPAIIDLGVIDKDGSKTVRVPHHESAGGTLLTATADGDEVANRVLTDDKTTVSVARYSDSVAPSDLARMTDQHGVLDGSYLAEQAFIRSLQTDVNLLAALVGTHTNVVGTSGSKATLKDFLDAERTLDKNNVEGPYLGVFHTDTWADIKEDWMLNSGGSIQWHPAGPEMLARRGRGYVGRLGRTDVFVTTRVPTVNAGADRGSGIFGRGAYVTVSGRPSVDNPAEQVLLGGRVLFELDRKARGGATEFVTHYYTGWAQALDAAGVSIHTKA